MQSVCDSISDVIRPLLLIIHMYTRLILDALFI